MRTLKTQQALLDERSTTLKSEVMELIASCKLSVVCVCVCFQNCLRYDAQASNVQS